MFAGQQRHKGGEIGGERRRPAEGRDEAHQFDFVSRGASLPGTPAASTRLRERLRRRRLRCRLRIAGSLRDPGVTSVRARSSPTPTWSTRPPVAPCHLPAAPPPARRSASRRSVVHRACSPAGAAA